MVAITKAEKDTICKQFPNVNIVRTMRQKSKRHHYYCEETKQVSKLLREMRDTCYETDAGRKDVSNADRENSGRI